MIWDYKPADAVMKTAVVLHNMIIEAKHDGNESELHTLVDMATSRSYIIEENSNEKEFKWHTDYDLIRTGSRLTECMFSHRIMPR